MKTMLRQIVVFSLLIIGFLTGEAQTDTRLSQHWAVPNYYNPAAAGTTDFLRIGLAGRLQWVGIEGAPKSALLAADTPLPLGPLSIGVGAFAQIEKEGLFSNISAAAQGAWQFKLGRGKLSAGVQLGYYSLRFEGSKAILPDGVDATEGIEAMRDAAGNAFDMGIGVHYSTKNFHVGVAAMHLLEPSVRFEGPQTDDTEAYDYETQLCRTLYFSAGGNIPFSNTLLELQPSMLVASDFKSFWGEASLRLTYRQLFMAGIGYRWNDAVSTMLGIQIKNFFLGYAYDVPVSKLAKAGSGSHELVAGYKMKLDLGKKKRYPQRSIRLM